MAAPTTVDEAIEQNALGPKSVTVGTETVVQQSIQDQIAAANYLANSGAAATAKFGLRFTKLIPPGAG